MKGLSFLISLLLVFSDPVALAQTVGGTAAAPPGQGADMIGVAGAVRGVVNVARAGKAGKVVQTGQALFIGDEVSTGPEGQMQILLLDETSFTIGPNSALVLDEFVYDPATHEGKVKARVVKGVFRFITGKIARKKPDNMQVELPVGNIGIRGTMVAGKTEGTHSLVVLMGPGQKNNAGARVGSFTLSNVLSNPGWYGVTVTKTGYGSEVDQGQKPSPPFLVPPDILSDMNSALMPKKDPDDSKDDDGDGDDGDSDDGSSATQKAGQDTAAAQGTSTASGGISNLGEGLNIITVESIQDAGDTRVINDGITPVADLLTIETGQFSFEQNNVAFNGSGTYDFDFDIDFGARTVGGGNSAVETDSSTIVLAQTFLIPKTDFSNIVGDAKFTASVTSSSGANCNVTPNCTADIVITLNNSGGVVAANAAHSVTISNENSSTDTGSGTANRVAGLST